MEHDFPTKPLGEVCENFDRLRVPLSSRERDERRGVFPYYGAAGVIDYVEKPIFDGLYLLVGEDGSVATEDGRPVLQLPCGKFWVNNHAHVLRGRTDNETRYLNYALSTVHIRPYLSGSVQPKLTQENLNRIEIPYPSEVARRGIVSILASLDDKIELNRRVNQTLEEICRALFKFWFVDFGPVRAKAEGRWKNGESLLGCPADMWDLWPSEFEESEIGEIPNGWQVGHLEDMATITMGQSPPGDTYNKKGKGSPFYQGVKDFGRRFPTRRVYCTAPTRLAEAGDILLSVRAPIGQTNIATERSAIGRGLCSVRPRSGGTCFALCLLNAQAEAWEMLEAKGTVFGAATKDDVRQLVVPLPREPLVEYFGRFGKVTDDLLLTSHIETGTLSALRDALLPKLLSGEIRVSDAGA